jgi:hypothetical protein
VIPARHPRPRLLQRRTSCGRCWPTPPLQRGDGAADLCAGGDAAGQRHDPAPRRSKAAGFALEWEEKPYEWIYGHHFRQARVSTKGPFRRLGPVFDLEPDGAGGSKVSYALEWEPLTLVGRLFGARLARQAGEVVGKRILEGVAFAKGARATHFDLAPPDLPQGARAFSVATAHEEDRRTRTF